MANATCEAQSGPLRLQFDRSVKLAFRGSSISSDGGLLLHRELNHALGLTDTAADLIADPRIGRNGRHRLAALLRQSIFSRLAGYEDVNDADRLMRDPIMRQLVGGRAVKCGAASASAIGRFERRLDNLTALADLPGRWSLPNERVLAFERGTAEQYIREGKYAFKWTRLSCMRFAANAARLQLHALAYNLANFLRTLALPDEVAQWSLTTLREKLIKIGARIVRHGRYVVFQLAEVAVPRALFAAILRRIDRLRGPPVPAT